MPIQMSGWLPGEGDQNLTERAEQLARAFHAQIAERGEADVLVAAVVMLRVESVRRPAHQDKGETVYVRVAGLEIPAREADDGVLRDTWRSLRDERNGNVPIDGFDAATASPGPGGDVGENPGVATSRPAGGAGNVLEFRG